MYVLGGEEGLDRHHDTIEVYDPVGDSWSIAGYLTSSRSWLSAAPITIRLEGSYISTEHGSYELRVIGITVHGSAPPYNAYLT